MSSHSSETSEFVTKQIEEDPQQHSSNGQNPSNSSVSETTESASTSKASAAPSAVSISTAAPSTAKVGLSAAAKEWMPNASAREFVPKTQQQQQQQQQHQQQAVQAPPQMQEQMVMASPYYYDQQMMYDYGQYNMYQQPQPMIYGNMMYPPYPMQVPAMGYPNYSNPYKSHKGQGHKGYHHQQQQQQQQQYNSMYYQQQQQQQHQPAHQYYPTAVPAAASTENSNNNSSNSNNNVESEGAASAAAYSGENEISREQQPGIEAAVEATAAAVHEPENTPGEPAPAEKELEIEAEADAGDVSAVNVKIDDKKPEGEVAVPGEEEEGAATISTVTASSTPSGSPRGEGQWSREVDKADQQWKRGESMGDNLKKQDGVVRYDKMSLICKYSRGKLAPEEIKKIYPKHSKNERLPILPRGFNINQLGIDMTPHADEQKIFREDRDGFKYEPDRLADASDPAVIAKKAILILNKLTVTKFEKLSDEFMAVGLSSDAMMPLAVDMIVQKAQTEEHFCFMYADLCRKMTDLWDSEVVNNPNIVVAKDAATSSSGAAAPKAEGEEEEGAGKKETLGAKFRQLLLNRCSEEFSVDRTKALQEIQEMSIDADAKLEKEIILKKRYTGHMRFIGEIYRKDLVGSKIMQTCITELLQSEEEEQLVCLVKLFSTIGSKLEAFDVKRNKNFVRTSFEKIEALSNDNRFPSRIRFMLKDLIDLRRGGWQARREPEQAKKISDAAAGTQTNPAAAATATAAAGTPRSQDARATSEWSVVGGAASNRRKVAVDTAAAPQGQGRISTVRSDSNLSSRSGGTPSGASAPAGGGQFQALSKAAAKPASKQSTPTATGTTPKFGGKSGGEKEKSPKGFGGRNKLGSKSADRLNSLTPTTSENVSSEQNNENDQPVTSTLITAEQIRESKDEQRKLRTTLDEYYSNGVEEDTLTEFRAYEPEAWSEILKHLVLAASEKKESEQESFCKLLQLVHSEGLLTGKPIVDGLYLLMDEMPDQCLDIPKLVPYAANYVAFLLVNRIIDINFVLGIPEDNNFQDFMQASEFLGHVLEDVGKYNANSVGDAAVTPESCFREIESFGVMQKIIPEPKESMEEAQRKFITRFHLDFLGKA